MDDILKKKVYNIVFCISFCIMIALSFFSFFNKKLDNNPFFILLGLFSSLLALVFSLKFLYLNNKDKKN